MQRYIQFKTKPFTVEDSGRHRVAFAWKKTLTQDDCDLKPSEHTYFNSDLFPAMLNRYYRSVIGQHSETCYVDAMPAGVSIDCRNFLATVRIRLPAEFR